MGKKELSTQIKVRILEKGFIINKNALSGLGTKYKEEHYGYDNSNWGVDAGTLVPSELKLPGNIVVCTHIRPESPYEVREIDGKKFFCEGDEVLSEVAYLPRPKLWNQSLNNGLNIKKIANFYGSDCLNFNIYSGCEFWDHGLPCKFCSVSPTQKSFNQVVVKKSEAQIEEAADKAFNSGDKINFVLTTGGSTCDPDAEFDAHVSALNIIKKYAPWKNTIKGNTALMPPLKLSALKRLYDTGMEHPSFNLEVWGKSKFQEICPGKEKFRGYDRILGAYRYAIKEFYGEGALWCNFVAGINSLETLKKGFTEMANMGAVPGANVFHPDVGAVLGNKLKAPSAEYIQELYQHAAEIYHEKGYKPFFSESTLRNSVANEAYKGWL